MNSDAAQTNGGRVVLEPGCYGNLLIDGPVFLNAGEYILNRGNLVVGGSAELTCTSCTIFLTSEQAGTDPWSIGKVQIDPKAKVKMAAPTQGPNAGLLIFQDRRAAGTRDETREYHQWKQLFGAAGADLLPGADPARRCGQFAEHPVRPLHREAPHFPGTRADLEGLLELDGDELQEELRSA